MALIVQKFGGSSVADAQRIMSAAKRAVDAKRAGNQVVMVISARGDKTDELIDLARQVSEVPPPREMDMLLATGEQESVALVAMAVQALGEPAISLTGYQIGILTDSTYTKARIREIKTDRMRKALAEGKIVVAAGFQGIDDDFNITTLGRGGSDTTATALAAVLEADVCEIYTDVEGIFTTDPRMIKNARKLPRISYDEMLELTSLGGGKMHSRSIEFAKKYRVLLQVRPAYTDGEGTLIAPLQDGTVPMVTGVALVKSEAIVNLRQLPDRPGVLATLFTKMAERRIPIDMVIQDIAEEGIAEVTFTVPQDDLAEALTAAEQAVRALGFGEVHHGTNVAKVSVVGAGMRTHTGVAAQMFKSLSDSGVNIQMITTSEIKISVLVNRDQREQALKSVHEGFQLDQEISTPPAIGFAQIGKPKSHVSRDELERDVVSRLASMEDIVVSEVQLDTNQSRITVRNIADQPGVAAEIFAAVAEGGVMVDLIVQNIGHGHQADISFTVPRTDLERCLLLLRELVERWPGTNVSFEKEIAMLSVMGIGLRSHTGVGEKMFRALASAAVNIQMVNTSEIRISAVVAPKDATKAHTALLNVFGREH
ncbi:MULTISPECIES: aspartate kinase [unclassified Schlesneria]|uniref:aspartate kinase n=1 Tax=unclassified Schlesneria TaxID=2762017 RepID=UPI002EF607E5